MDFLEDSHLRVTNNSNSIHLRMGSIELVATAVGKCRITSAPFSVAASNFAVRVLRHPAKPEPNTPMFEDITATCPWVNGYGQASFDDLLDAIQWAREEGRE